jgi:heme exporter protein B
VNVFLAVLWKDLVSEWRTRDRVLSMLLFSVLVVIVFHFALPADASQLLQTGAAGLLWVAYLFASVLGLNRAFALELENEALSGLALAPANRGWIFLGKAAANTLLLFLVQAVTALAFALAFELSLSGVVLRFAVVMALGALGLSSLGTLLAAVAVRTRYREVMLPLLLLPLMIPVLLGAVGASTALLERGALPSAELRLLVVVDAVFLIASFLLFEYVLDE